jgi:hypothetical protein
MPPYMETLHLNWEDFVEQYTSKKIKARVDLAKGDDLIRTGGLPSYWKMSRKIMKGITVFTAVTALIAFFMINPVAGLAIGALVFVFRGAIRQEASRAVINTALQQPMFYSRALASKTLQVYRG